MTGWYGYFDEHGAPRLNISISIPGAGPTESDAILDTGFTGFLLVPISLLSALPASFEDIKTLRLADGTKVMRLQVMASVIVNGQTIDGIAFVEPEGREVLLGMKFLQSAGRG